MFNVYRNKYRAAAGLLAVMLAFCLVLGSVPFAAEAAASLAVNPASSNAGAATNYNFTFTANDVSLATGDVAGKDMEIVFPEGFAVSSSPAVEVDVTVNSEVYYAYVAPVVDSANSPYKATLTVPASIGLPASAMVSSVAIKGLAVTNTKTAGSYAVSVTFKGPATPVTVQENVTINPVVGSITLTSPTTTPTGTAGSRVSVLVKGEVKDIAGNPYANIGINFSATKPDGTPVDTSGLTVSPSSVATMADGTFAATVQFTPTKAGTYTVTVSAGDKSDSFNVTVNPAAAAKLVWVGPPTSSISPTGRTALTVQLRDQHDNPVSTTSAITVDLAAFDSSKAMAGRFYDAATGGSEITSVTIPAGSNSATVYLQPLNADSSITVEARAAGLTAAKIESLSVAAAQPDVSFTFNGLDNPPYGTVDFSITVKVADNGAISEDTPLRYKAVVEKDDSPLNEQSIKYPDVGDDPNDPSTWSEITTDESGEVWFGPQDGFTLQALPELTGEGVTTPFRTTLDNGTYSVTVYLMDISNSSNPVALGSATKTFTIAGMSRQLNAGWNVLSTPLKLAGDGGLQALGFNNDNLDIAWTYVNGQWSQVTTQALNPLQGYVVKVKQNIIANYTFKKAATVQEAVPPTRDLSAGWNLVGVGTDDTSKNVSNVLASVKGKYSVVVNPGLGNAVWGKSAVTADDNEQPSVGRGDAYWVFMNEPGTLAGLMAPEMAQ